MDASAMLEHRAAKDEFFRSDDRSPIPRPERAAFAGLAYFDPDPSWSFAVAPTSVEPRPVTIATTTGDDRTYVRTATVEMTRGSAKLRLALLATGHPGYFLPFRDATSGGETYGAGRYLDITEPDENGMVTIDFNLAYQPFCAYNSAYSCALPPAENWLDIAICAGERLIDGEPHSA